MSTATMVRREAAGTAPEPPPGRPRRPRWMWVLLAVVAVMAVLAVVVLDRLVPEVRNPITPEIVDRSQPAVLKALEDLTEYRAASGQFQVILDVEDKLRYVPSFIKGERTLFVAGGSVEATVDFGALGQDAVTVSPDRRSVSVALPHARLSDPRIDPSASYVYDRERGLLDRVGSVFDDNPTSERDLYLLAEDKLATAARESDIAARAEANTARMLESLLGSLGFTRVEIMFR